ncbi:MAG: GNAT family N-acetyltransferase [Bacteroidetes bacterium]|nr:GNAT family N-acetyltransferase [Bacteroidota bacterium]
MTSDIHLRPWKKEDAAQLALIANNKKIWNNVRDSLPHPYTLKDAQNWIAHCKTQKPVMNFAVIYQSALTGSIGCVAKDDIYKKNMELGYFIGEAFWNNGIATEAVRILLNYIEKQFDVVRVYAEVYAHNKASMQVLRNNGFYLETIRRKNVFKNKELMDEYVWVKILE